MKEKYFILVNETKIRIIFETNKFIPMINI